MSPCMLLIADRLIWTSGLDELQARLHVLEVDVFPKNFFRVCFGRRSQSSVPHPPLLLV